MEGLKSINQTKNKTKDESMERNGNEFTKEGLSKALKLSK